MFVCVLNVCGKFSDEEWIISGERSEEEKRRGEWLVD